MVRPTLVASAAVLCVRLSCRQIGTARRQPDRELRIPNLLAMGCACSRTWTRALGMGGGRCLGCGQKSAKANLGRRYYFRHLACCPCVDAYDLFRDDSYDW